VLTWAFRFSCHAEAGAARSRDAHRDFHNRATVTDVGFDSCLQFTQDARGGTPRRTAAASCRTAPARQPSLRRARRRDPNGWDTTVWRSGAPGVVPPRSGHQRSLGGGVLEDLDHLVIEQLGNV
jgi:hypothetical protein